MSRKVGILKGYIERNATIESKSDHLQLVRCLKNQVKTQVQITKNSFDKLTKLVICKKK